MNSNIRCIEMCLIIKKFHRHSSWIVTLDVLKSWNNQETIWPQNGWIVTLDVLKSGTDTTANPTTYGWIVTLDVLKSHIYA